MLATMIVAASMGQLFSCGGGGASSSQMFVNSAGQLHTHTQRVGLLGRIFGSGQSQMTGAYTYGASSCPGGVCPAPSSYYPVSQTYGYTPVTYTYPTVASYATPVYASPQTPTKETPSTPAKTTLAPSPIFKAIDPVAPNSPPTLKELTVDYNLYSPQNSGDDEGAFARPQSGYQLASSNRLF